MTQSDSEIQSEISKFRRKLGAAGMLSAFFPSPRNARIILAHIIIAGAPITEENLMKSFTGLVTDGALFGPDTTTIHPVEEPRPAEQTPEDVKIDNAVDELAGLGELE